MKAIRQRGAKRKGVLLRALLELYLDKPLRISVKELNDLESFEKLEEIRGCSNKEPKFTRELLERVRNLKEFATLGKQKSFQYVSDVPGMAYNPFIDKEARVAYSDFEQALILSFWVAIVRELWMISTEQLQSGVSLQKRAIEPSVPKLEGHVSFVCGS